MSAKPLLEFVDTNILVYAYDQSAGDPGQTYADVRVKNPFLVTDAVAPSSYN